MSGGGAGPGPRILFLTTHLAGSGHLVRSLAVAEAAARRGARVTVLNGGRALAHLPAPGGAYRVAHGVAPGVELVQIPPLRVAGRDFSRPLAADGQPADAAYLRARQAAVVAEIAAARPAVLVTETFPLGRRRLAAEFEAAIAAARAADPAVRIVCSVRDVPEPPSRPERLAEAEARLAGYDAVLVHGAEAVLPLAQSWPLGPAAARLVRHTGYVAGPAADPLPGAGGEVLVAVGGGDLGRRLLDCAAEAAVRSPHLWRLRVGGADAAAHARALAARHPGATMVAEPAAADYRARLAAAACSVSLAGYNTVMDLAPLTTPAVLVPDTTGGEREQAIRAAALAGHPGIAVLELEALTPAQLAETVEALAGRARPPLPLALDGAERAAAALLALALPERSPAERSPAGRSPAERSTA